MGHRTIYNKARVWIVTRAADGSIIDEIDPALLASPSPSHCAKKRADLLATTAGEIELGENRLW